MFLKTLILFSFSFSFSLCVHSLEVKTSSGVVRGKAFEVRNKTVNQFLNIPYAEPPVGKLRFSKPVPLKEPKKGVIDGTTSGHSCFQNVPVLSLLERSSEDCLVLNVISPETKNSTVLKAVMFFINGGAYRFGSIFDFYYDGKVLSTYDVVFVSANYRLGPLGWLYGGEESAPGNLGLYDQLLALKWVKQNIHLFGGDSNQITIFGESAGSWSASAHVVSPLSRGLFKRAILESGAVFDNKNSPRLSKDMAFSQAKAMANHFLCFGSQWLDCLRGVNARLLNTYLDLDAYVTLDTEFMPISAQKAFNTQNYSTDIDIMAGVMENEGSFSAHLLASKSEHLKSRDEFRNFVKTLPVPGLNTWAEDSTEFYLKNVDTTSTEALKLAFYDFYGDVLLKCTTYLFAKQFAEHSPKRNVYFYQWTYPSPLLTVLGCTKDMGVCHGSDIEFVFGLFSFMSAKEKSFSEDVLKMWTNFAKNGQPMEGFPSGYHWPRLIEAGTGVTNIKEINPAQPNHIYENLWANTCDGFWKNYFI